MGRRAVGQRGLADSPSSPRRAITSRKSCASPTPPPAQSATCSKEKVPTFFESGNGRVNWRYLPESKEFIWFSERDNWGHLYLYDSETGKLKNQITKGEWNVTQLLRVDEKNRHALLPRRRPREGPRSLLHPLLPHRLRRRESHAAHAGGRQSRSDALHLRQVFRGQLLQARRAARRRAARRYGQAARDAGAGRHRAS